MAYNESDYIVILDKIKEFLDDKSLEAGEIFFLIKKIIDIFEKFPAYSGFLPEILEDSVKNVEVSSLEKNDFVMMKSGKDCFTGYVKDVVDEQKIKLTEIFKFNSYRNKTFDLDKIDEIKCFISKSRQEKLDEEIKSNEKEVGEE